MIRALLIAVMVLLLSATGIAQEFQRALPGYTYTFPRDHGSHPSFKTEWWYFTGNLEAGGGRRFGYELTIFRNALAPPATDASERSALTPADVFLGHFAISDFESEGHFHREYIGRVGLGQAAASADRMAVRVGPLVIDQDESGMIRVSAHDEELALELELDALKPAILHGIDGVHQKSGGAGEASHYISFTRLDTKGKITVDGEAFAVSGLSWMDHEFFTSSLNSEAVGWDWFSLQFDSGEDLMLYRIRRADGSFESEATGTLVTAEGEKVLLPAENHVIDSTDTWTSPETGAVYPMGWTVRFPEDGSELTVLPVFEGQEMTTTRFTGVVYWEGAVTVSGTLRGDEVTGRGYVELVGYHSPFSQR